MYIKRRTKSKELIIREALRGRWVFSAKEEWDFINRVSGHEGECNYDELTVFMDDALLILNDLLIEDGVTAQVDSLIVAGNVVYVFDVKNFTGPIYYRDGALQSEKERFINNPLERLERTRLLLERILRKNGFPLKVIARLVFINPEMLLYGNQPDLPILLYPQIQPFLAKIKVEDRYYAQQVATFLMNIHLEENPYEKLMAYDYDRMQKGILCPSCRIELRVITSRSLACTKCCHKEIKSDAIVRNIKEFTVLFPNQKVTVPAIYDWCGRIISKKTIRDVMKKNKLGKMGM